MAPLQPPDTHHLNAAAGWLELGNPREAAAEMDRLSATARSHPDTLEVLWRLCAAGRRWVEALDIARSLIRLAPDQPSGWINQSYSLHELKRTEEALSLLRPLVERFPEVGAVAYNLACYSCQLDRLAEAREWLEKAVKAKSRGEIRQLALADADLRPLWPEIAQWADE